MSAGSRKEKGMGKPRLPQHTLIYAAMELEATVAEADSDPQ